MIARMYKSVMDPEWNPLWRLTKMVRFQYMTILAFMWSGIFALWSGTLAVFGPSAIVHALLLAGVFSPPTFLGVHRNISRAIEIE